MMKKIILTLFVTIGIAIGVNAQGNQPPQKFSPEKFDADLKEFIKKEACLTDAEADAFFPIYKEMLQKQRSAYGRQRNMGLQKPQDEQGCKKAIQMRDELELEMKRIQQTYHTKFLEILPATKVYDIIIAEDRFHRRMLRGWRNMGNMGPGHRNNPMDQKEKPQK